MPTGQTVTGDSHDTLLPNLKIFRHRFALPLELSLASFLF